MDMLLSIGLGVGLAAACGFRIFVPPLAMTLAERVGYLELAEGFAWLDSERALWILAAAMALETLAYFIPFLDNALDTLATPAATGAGILASASVLGDVPPPATAASAHCSAGETSPRTEALARMPAPVAAGVARVSSALSRKGMK